MAKILWKWIRSNGLSHMITATQFARSYHIWSMLLVSQLINTVSTAWSSDQFQSVPFSMLISPVGTCLPCQKSCFPHPWVHGRVDKHAEYCQDANTSNASVHIVGVFLYSATKYECRSPKKESFSRKRKFSIYEYIMLWCRSSDLLNRRLLISINFNSIVNSHEKPTISVDLCIWASFRFLDHEQTKRIPIWISDRKNLLHIHFVQVLFALANWTRKVKHFHQLQMIWLAVEECWLIGKKKSYTRLFLRLCVLLAHCTSNRLRHCLIANSLNDTFDYYREGREGKIQKIKKKQTV